MTTEGRNDKTVALPRPVQQHDGKSEAGVVKIVGDTQLPREFITVGRDFDEAIGRTTLLDDNQLNDVIAYKSQLMEFGLLEELQDLISWLNARPAVGGYNRIQALMAHIGIMSPEALGVSLSKKGFEDLKRRQDEKLKQASDDQHKA